MYRVFKKGLKSKGLDLSFEDFCIIKDHCDTIKEYVDFVNKKYNTDYTMTEAYLEYIAISSKIQDLSKYYEYVDELVELYPQTRFIILSNQDDKVIQKFVNEWKLAERFEKIISCPQTGLSKEYIYDNFSDFFKDLHIA